MNSSDIQLASPKRNLLSTQAADTIRHALAENVWRDQLPSERKLCEILQISRPTVRTALRILAGEGLFIIQQGRRNRLLLSPETKQVTTKMLVGLITHEPLSKMSFSSYETISKTRALLSEQGFKTIVLVCPRRGLNAQKKRLEEFLQQNTLACFVLLSVSKEIQTWFLERSLPAFVLGSCHPGIELPSLDIDYRAVCRHAAGVLIAMGHRNIAFLLPDWLAAGDSASEEGFLEAAQQNNPHKVELTVLRHNGAAEQVCKKLDSLLRSNNPPTGLLIARPRFTLAAILHLLKSGIRVPEKLSLIARDYDPLFESVSPMLAHYSLSNSSMAQRICRTILRLAKQHSSKPTNTLLFPNFVKGHSVSAPNS